MGRFPRYACKKKASEPEGPEAVIPVISLVALLYGDAEAASGGTRQHQNASSEASFRHSCSIVESSLQFFPVCRSLSWFVLMRLSLKNARESMGSYLDHGFSGHPGRFPGSRWVTANCEQQLMGHMDVIFQGRARQRSPLQTLS